MEGALPVGTALENISEYLEYWRNYKDERISIREKNVVRDNSKNSPSIRQTVHVIEGEVDDVLGTPPGFMLTDVKEFVRISDMNMQFGAGSAEVQGVSEGGHGKQTLRKVDKKFVSFSEIDELEPTNVSEEATEPFRE